MKVELQEAEWSGIDWNVVAEDRDRWWALVMSVMKLQLP